MLYSYLQISLDSDDEEQLPAKKLKTEDVEGAPSARAAGPTPSNLATPAPPARRSAKDRERERIKLELDEIRLQREENRLKRRMMDLQDDE